VPERFGDALPDHVTGQVDGGLQADTDMEMAVDDPVEQFLAAVWPPGDSGPGEVREILAPPGLGDVPGSPRG
jgi:hypothetical protein